jgi:hypothetical protein
LCRLKNVFWRRSEKISLKDRDFPSQFCQGP